MKFIDIQPRGLVQLFLLSLCTLLLAACERERPSLIDSASPITLDSPSISTAIKGLGDYGKETSEGFILKAPAGFHLPSGTQIQKHNKNRNFINKESPRLTCEIVTDLFFTETWTSSSEVTIQFKRYIRDPYMLTAGTKNESVTGEVCSDFKADYLQREDGKRELTEGERNASWSASPSQGAIIRSAEAMLGVDQIAAAIGSDEKAHRVGDQWDMDVDKLSGPLAQLSALGSPLMGGTSINLEGLKGYWRLDRIENLRGVRCAVLVSSIEGTLPIQGDNYEFKSSNTLWQSLELPICIASKADSSCATTGSEAHEVAATHSSTEASYQVP